MRKLNSDKYLKLIKILVFGNNVKTLSKCDRFAVLDGWRGISIISVMACHMLPLGPKSTYFNFNNTAGFIGMSLFFTLSGFLITKNLYQNRNIKIFFIKRITRILPLAYLYLSVTFIMFDDNVKHYLLSLLFTQNYLHSIGRPETGHFWSLCVEIHFYFSVALLMVVTRFKGFKLLPCFFVAILIMRVYTGVQGNIKTHYRVDEILGGAIIALIYLNHNTVRIRKLIANIHWSIWLLLLFFSCHAFFGPFMYFRAVFASCLVGHTIFSTREGAFPLLHLPVLRYIGEISYALYVWHPLTYAGWLGTGDTLVRYSKRMISFLLSFILAHLSTYYYEMPITKYGRKISKRYSNDKEAKLSTITSGVLCKSKL